jgi:fumarate reductase flavoprotein subunit
MAANGTDYDVVVVGSGAAGMAASLEASAAGAGVLLVESQATLGGSSKLSGGIIMAAGTSVQQKAGIEDNPADLFHEYQLFNQYKVKPWLARRLAFDSGPAIEWLLSLGLEFAPDLIYGAEERAPRSHLSIGGGAGVVEVLESHVKRQESVDIAVGRRINRLLRDHDGRVVGVAVDDDVVRAGAVVIACGGFGANPGMWADHLPSAMAAGSAAWYIGAPGAQGDGLAFAAQVGAQIDGHDRALILPTPDFSTNLEVYYPGWLVMVNRAGARVVDEATSYAVMQVAHKEHGPLFAIFDEATKRTIGGPSGALTTLAGDGDEKHPPIVATGNWNADTIDDMTAKGRIKKASSLDQLAGLLAVDARGLACQLGRYNGFVGDRGDKEFFKSPDQMREVATPPFYGVELRNGIICLTSKGPVTDADARVLDRGGQPICGLYAAGECTGGVLGDMYMGSGNSYANCIVFGRIAGQTAVRDAVAMAAAVA